jgi:FAD/FMN-containing dehydrogenase
MSSLIDRLVAVLGAEGVLLPADLRSRATSFWDAAPMSALALVRPRSTAEVSAVLALCHAARRPIVVQGGLTGTVAGAVAGPDRIALSLERMSAIESIDLLGGTCCVQAGAVLQAVNDALASTGMCFPLDLGARGSCTIGGNVATNAGGINVLRYGMMRSLVLGLEAVLADGTVVSSLNVMQKNNAGYDLKQLFIGSEGTLGVVTRAVLRLYPRTTSRQTALLALPGFDAASELLVRLQRDLGGTLSAFEAMWQGYLDVQIASGRYRAPFGRAYPLYAVVEAEGASPESDPVRFAALLGVALEEGLMADAVIAQSERERREIWDLREDLEAIVRIEPTYRYDVSLPIPEMPGYLRAVEAAIGARWPAGRCEVMGHVADGNLHLFVQPNEAGTTPTQSDEIVYGLLRSLGGSVSAEHGIGFEKKAWLRHSRSEQEVRLMRDLKRALDPAGILNPGCVVDA